MKNPTQVVIAIGTSYFHLKMIDVYRLQCLLRCNNSVVTKFPMPFLLIRHRKLSYDDDNV